MADDDDKLGFGFFAKLAGIVFVAGVAGLIILLILTRAIYAWGFIGGFLLFCAVLLLIGWFYDRRQVDKYYAEE